jgi:hypothetical protein
LTFIIDKKRERGRQKCDFLFSKYIQSIHHPSLTHISLLSTIIGYTYCRIEKGRIITLWVMVYMLHPLWQERYFLIWKFIGTILGGSDRTSFLSLLVPRMKYKKWKVVDKCSCTFIFPSRNQLTPPRKPFIFIFSVFCFLNWKNRDAWRFFEKMIDPPLFLTYWQIATFGILGLYMASLWLFVAQIYIKLGSNRNKQNKAFGLYYFSSNGY